MKNIFIGFSFCLSVVALLFSFKVFSAQTLDLEDSYRDGNNTICVYSDGRHTATVTKSGAGSCPSKYTKR